MKRREPRRRRDELEVDPGAAPREITRDLVCALRDAEARYLARPEPRSGWDGEAGLDWNVRRLRWLAWWCEWAMKNCDKPAIHIT